MEHINKYDSLNIQGLMTILPWGLSPTEALEAFEGVAELSSKIRAEGYSQLKMTELSMGMSGDYKLAIQAGASHAYTSHETKVPAHDRWSHSP